MPREQGKLLLIRRGKRRQLMKYQRRKSKKPQKWQCRSQRFLLQLGKFWITLLWILNKTKSLDLMEYIQEPSRRQEGHDGHDQSREEDYKVVLDFSFYCIIDGWLHP